MDDKSDVSSALQHEDAIGQAIKEFQRFAGLNETGNLDNLTMAMMNTPRCGVRDRVGHGESARRRRRYALQGSKWRVTSLTYRISKYPRRIKDRQRVEKEIARAFRVWSSVSPLNFTERKSGRVHIDVRFEEGEHGDGDPFDGPGRTLAHAFFPQFGGDAHFDDEEKWSLGLGAGTNLFQVAAHEFGHSLGLSHSDVRSALMAPFYRGYDAGFKLDNDDILAIQSLYGTQVDTEEQSTTPAAPAAPSTARPVSPDSGDGPDLCQDPSIDAITTTADGSTYVFKGEYYWKVLSEGLAEGFPRKIAEDWDGVPDNIDAVLTWSDGKTFIFKGDQYWRFNNLEKVSGYPKKISVGFTGVPDNVDAAFLWSGNGKTYFFKGDQYWRYDSRAEPPVSDRYPRPISNWNGLANNIDAAFKWTNGRTYFFKGKNYYRFNDRTFAVDSEAPGYPRPTATWWFDCRPVSQAAMRQPAETGTASSSLPVDGLENFDVTAHQHNGDPPDPHDHSGSDHLHSPFTSFFNFVFGE
ncbi:Mmp1 [Cordylochernes scorpioides]|uniref:Mmp1 n=1 Tax=Cordylochernes scorpioides TaxID=51811 RepID=A0ABY6LGW2_9ARAC|nr:Mmp1 [Cordylochernes scorpioides]